MGNDKNQTNKIQPFLRSPSGVQLLRESGVSCDIGDVVFKTDRVRDMAQLVKTLTAKPDDLSSVPTRWKGRSVDPPSCSLTSAHRLQHRCIHRDNK